MVKKRFDIELPEDVLLSINESEGELKDRLKLLLAIQLYQWEKITLGKAAEIADLSQLEFETALSTHQIPISMLSFEEVLNDAEKLI